MPRLATGIATVLACALVGVVARGALDGAAPTAGRALPVAASGPARHFALGAAQSRSAPRESSIIATAKARVVRIHDHPADGARGSHLLRARTLGGSSWGR